MTTKLAAATTVVGWVGAIGSSAAQLVVDEQTRIPIGIAVACVGAAILGTWKLTRYFSRIEARLRTYGRALRALGADLGDADESDRRDR